MFLSSLWQKLSSHLQSSPIDYFLNFQYKVSLNQLQIDHWNNLLILHVDGALSCIFWSVLWIFLLSISTISKKQKPLLDNFCNYLFAIIFEQCNCLSNYSPYYSHHNESYNLCKNQRSCDNMHMVDTQLP